MTRFLVTGADFGRTEGVISIVDVDERSGKLELLDEHWIEHPDPSLAVKGKGFTGCCLDGDRLWTCFSNLVVAIDLNDFEVVEIIADSLFNDLHHVEMNGDELLIANTGNESIDRVRLADGNIERIDLLGEHLRNLRPERKQSEDTKPHIHHLSSVTTNEDGDLIVGLVRQGRVLNLSKWDWMGPRLGSPIHDVQVLSNGKNRQQKLWFTTVPGQVHCHSVGQEDDPEMWDLSDHLDEVGWTRGLGITNHGLLVGTTAIRQSNHDYFHSFTRSRVGQVAASLTWIPFDDSEESVTLELPGALTRKVFSIRRWDVGA